MADELLPFLAAINEENRPFYKIYIPSYIVELFHIVREQKGKEVVGTQNITMMSAEFKGLDVTVRVFYPYFQGFMEGRSLLVVYVFTSPDSPRGPPWNEGHRPKVRHETDVLEVPASGTT